MQHKRRVTFSPFSYPIIMIQFKKETLYNVFKTMRTKIKPTRKIIAKKRKVIFSGDSSDCRHEKLQQKADCWRHSHGSGSICGGK